MKHVEEVKKKAESGDRLQQILKALAWSPESLECEEKVSLSSEAISLLRQSDLELDHAQVLGTIAKLEEMKSSPDECHLLSSGAPVASHQAEVHTAILADLAATELDPGMALQDLLLEEPTSEVESDNDSDACKSNSFQYTSEPFCGSCESIRGSDLTRLTGPIPETTESLSHANKDWADKHTAATPSHLHGVFQSPSAPEFLSWTLPSVDRCVNSNVIHRPLALPPPLFNPAKWSLSKIFQFKSAGDVDCTCADKGNGAQGLDRQSPDKTTSQITQHEELLKETV